MNELGDLVFVAVLIFLLLAAIALIIISFIYYVKMLKSADKHANGYFISYKKMKTMAQAMDRTKKDFHSMFKIPNEFKNKELIQNLRVYRWTYWVGLLLLGIIILIATPFE